MASMLELALRYARQGIRVAPMRPENKRPFTEHGIKDATTDEDLIRFWWRKWRSIRLSFPFFIVG